MKYEISYFSPSLPSMFPSAGSLIAQPFHISPPPAFSFKLRMWSSVKSHTHPCLSMPWQPLSPFHLSAMCSHSTSQHSNPLCSGQTRWKNCWNSVCLRIVASTKGYIAANIFIWAITDLQLLLSYIYYVASGHGNGLGQWGRILRLGSGLEQTADGALGPTSGSLSSAQPDALLQKPSQMMTGYQKPTDLSIGL